MLTLRVKASGENPTLPSITAVAPGAILQERELAEVFGMHITNLPARGRLLLSEDWPENLFPMRKKNTPEAIRARISEPPPAPLPGSSPERPGRFVVPIGPQHPALKEPAHFELEVDGEIVKDVSLRLGYVHQGNRESR